MKAVVVDLDGKNAVALCDNGRFEKIKNRNYSIGQEIIMQAKTVRFPKQAAIAASVALMITTCGGMGTYTWSNPISYVSLDINPSIAYSLNEFNRVISVNGMNDEGVAIVDAIGGSLKNTDITTALTLTVEQLSSDAYLDADNTNYMVIGVYSDKDSKANALMSTVDAFTASTSDTCSITTVNVSKETKESADAYGITGGKMELINEIAHVVTDPEEVDPATLADLTVAELEQTKAVAATGASVSEAVAAALPASKDTEPTDAPEIPVDPNAVSSDSKPTDDSDSISSSNKGESPAAAAASDTATVGADTANTSQATDNKATGSAVNANNSSANSSSSGNNSDKGGNGSSEKKDEKPDESPTKGESTSSEKKGESSSSDKNAGSSSEKKGEVTEDSSQQTNNDFNPEAPDNTVPEPEAPSINEVILDGSDDQISLCNMLS